MHPRKFHPFETRIRRRQDYVRIEARRRVPKDFAGFHEEGPPIREAFEAVERLNTDQVLRAGLPATIWWRDSQTEETTFPAAIHRRDAISLDSACDGVGALPLIR